MSDTAQAGQGRVMMRKAAFLSLGLFAGLLVAGLLGLFLGLHSGYSVNTLHFLCISGIGEDAQQQNSGLAAYCSDINTQYFAALFLAGVGVVGFVISALYAHNHYEKQRYARKHTPVLEPDAVHTPEKP